MQAVLLIQCPDQPGIVARVSECLYRTGANILTSDQHTTDARGGRFFMRLVFALADGGALDGFEESWRPLADELQADYSLHDMTKRPRMGILVSKFDHCLFDLLHRQRAGELAADIPIVLSNHEDARDLVERYGIPFQHIPMTKATKLDGERAIIDAARGVTDFLVFARYMQIVSDGFLGGYGKPIINIHHSFLPSFKGANPYRQAYERGVKLIGATAHYVTADLDEGPIIAQAVEPVYYKDNTDDLKRKGRNLEQYTLAAAIHAHIERRIIQYGNRTIVFQ